MFRYRNWSNFSGHILKKSWIFMTMMLFVVMETHDYPPPPPPPLQHNRSTSPPPLSLTHSLRSVSASPLHPLSPKALYFAHVQLNGTFHRLQDGVNTSGLRSASPFLAMWVRIPTLVYFLCRRSKSDTNSGESFIEVLEMCFSERPVSQKCSSLQAN